MGYHEFVDALTIRSSGIPPVVKGIIFIFFLVLLIIKIIISFLIYFDAKKSHIQSPALWGFVLFILPLIIGLPLYLIIRFTIKERNKITCVYCGKILKADFKVCPYCGKSHKKNCPNCNSPVEPDWNYCINCGASVKE